MEKLQSPDGKREWSPANAEERTNLIARGWRPAKSKAAPKPLNKSVDTNK